MSTIFKNSCLVLAIVNFLVVFSIANDSFDEIEPELAQATSLKRPLSHAENSDLALPESSEGPERSETPVESEETKQAESIDPVIIWESFDMKSLYGSTDWESFDGPIYPEVPSYAIVDWESTNPCPQLSSFLEHWHNRKSQQGH